MEDTKIHSIKELNVDFNYRDLRQTVEWSEFLKTLGWTSFVTPSGINVEIINSGFAKVAKVQRPKPLTAEMLKEIDEVCLNNKVAFVKFEPHLYQDPNVLVAHGCVPSQFPLIPPSTVFIDLTLSEEALWEKLTHSAKYSINRAKREKTRVEIIPNPTIDQVKQFQGLAVSTGAKKKFFVPSFAENKSKAELFKDKCYLAFSYNKEGVMTGAKFHLGVDTTIWYLHGGTSDLGQKDKSGYLLTWETILYFKNLGYKVFDLEGVLDPRFPLYTMNWEGLTHFKRKFNGYEVRFAPPMVKIYNKHLAFVNRYFRLPI